MNALIVFDLLITKMHLFCRYNGNLMVSINHAPVHSIVHFSADYMHRIGTLSVGTRASRLAKVHLYDHRGWVKHRGTRRVFESSGDPPVGQFVDL